MQALQRFAPHVARIFFGLIFFVFGLNGFLQFLPMPPMPDAAGQFMGALAATGYFFPLLKGTEVIGGLLLLSGRFVPLALTVLAPVVVNIFAFHVFLTTDIGMSVVLLGVHGYLAWAYRSAFAPLLTSKAAPSTAETAGPAVMQGAAA